MRTYLDDRFLLEHVEEILAAQGPFGALNEALTLWARHSAKPLVVLIDEIDSLIGDTLVSVLRQVRAGYADRPHSFPQSIILCGVRDVRDYRIHASSEKDPITGGSAFNIKAESMRMGDFIRAEVERLYQQHTAETGQHFTTEAIERMWELTQGQPWLVNALAYETCFRIKTGRDRTQPVTLEMVTQAKENLILRRETHLDQLVDKLQEPRVQRVMQPMLAGEELEESIPTDDIQYVIDLGLIQRRQQGLVIANPIYQEIIPRELTWVYQLNLEPLYRAEWYL